MNATSTFRMCHDITETWEGGWSNHPSDPGGKTMYGVTEAVYHAWLKSQNKAVKPVRNITITEAREIYFKEYWLKAGCSTLAMGVNLAVYDASVNSGVSRGRKWLLASIGGRDHETVKKICAARLSFMQSLKIWKTFGKGWARRVADIEAKGVAWALAAEKVAPKAVKLELEQESNKAETKVTEAVKGAATKGGGGLTGGTGGYLLSPEQADLAFNLFIGGVAVAGVIALAYYLSRAVIQSRRAEAYAAEAERI
ncbi:secretion activator protein [Brucella sp. HL-2]|nr:glycosyl hydrolase 108 family protein [Brucella sp. HL-2]MCV9910179.1 secretion activator protein [Brucella sp. HL-2]